MTTQILRTLDRWRFETPLSLALGASAGFVALTAPAQLFGQIPVAGDMGMAGRATVAAVLALVSGGIGYVAMRRPAKPAVAEAAPVEEIPEDEMPSGMPAERCARFRRADRHPDAPPREPIFASRDLGEPFMHVGAVPDAPAEEADAQWWPETEIPDAEFVEVDHEADHEAAPVSAPEVAEGPEAPVETPVVEAAAAAPIEAPVAPRNAGSIGEMMERLSSGLERRAATGAPARDPGPALRDALAELNRLAEKRD